MFEFVLFVSLYKSRPTHGVENQAGMLAFRIAARQLGIGSFQAAHAADLILDSAELRTGQTSLRALNFLQLVHSAHKSRQLTTSTKDLQS